MTIDELDKNHIIADKGKILRRISDGIISGREVYLGYSYRLQGEEVEPFMELPEHYEEIDEPITEDMDLITEGYPLVPTEDEIMTLEEEAGEPIPEEAKRVTYSDYKRLEQEVEQLKQTVYGMVK